MSVPYVRPINYLSPSSLRQLEKEPVAFYFQRLGPPEFAPPKEPQGFAAAVGIAFDAYVKMRVACVRRVKCPSLEFMLHDVQCEREKAIKMGAELGGLYHSCGAFKTLIDEKPSKLQVTLDDYAPGTKIPIQGKLDAVLGRRTPHDWKVRGANRPGLYSPTPGYERIFDTDGAASAHKRAGEPLEEVDEDWATQLTFYGWLIGNSPKKDFQGSIDQLIVGKEGRLRVAQFRKTITATYQQKVLDRVKSAWERIRDEAVIPPEMENADLETLQAIR